MITLEFHVDLLPDKHTEFMQSWQTFIDHVRNTQGLESFELNQADQHCRVLLHWTNKESLDKFFVNRWYAFFSGALKVLGTNSSWNIAS